MSRKGLRVAALVAVLLIAAIVLYRADDRARGAITPPSAVDAYLAALAAEDRGRLEKIADPEHDSAAEVSLRLTRFGGGKLRVTSRAVSDTDSEDAKTVRLIGTADGKPVTETLRLNRHDRRWFVALGPTKNASAARSPTAS